MNDLLVSVCIDISRFVPDDEIDLKTSLGSIIGTENLLKCETSRLKEPEKGLDLCNAAYALSDFVQSDMEHPKEVQWELIQRD